VLEVKASKLCAALAMRVLGIDPRVTELILASLLYGILSLASARRSPLLRSRVRISAVGAR
jgi:hypothetical protein